MIFASTAFPLDAARSCVTLSKNSSINPEKAVWMEVAAFDDDGKGDGEKSADAERIPPDLIFSSR
jgi:hypothetical protein